MRNWLAMAVATALSGQAAALEVVEDCSTWVASARNIPQPVTDYVRTFANGNVRVILLDTIEPAAGAVHLMVETPPWDELGSRRCVMISEGGGMGFSNLYFLDMSAGYDPSTGLILRIPAERFATSTGGFDPAILAITINQATGAVIPWWEIP